MAMGESDNEKEFIEQLKSIEEMGFKSIRDDRSFDIVIPYGVNQLVVDGDNENPVNHKVYTESANPVIAMAEVWENHMQLSIGAGISTLLEMIVEQLEKNNDTDMVIRTLKSMAKDEGVIETFMKGVYRTQPDVISIGNPNILANIVTGTIPDGKFSDDVEDFLKKVTVKDEEE